MNPQEISFTIIFTTLIILLLIAGVGFTIIITSKKAIKQQMQLAEMKLSFEKELRTIQQEVQEQTLTQISRELHDHIGQKLTVINLQLEKEKFKNPELQPTLSSAGNTLREVIQQVRLLSHSLNTDFIQERGILESLKQEVKRLQQIADIQIHWDYDNGPFILKGDQAIVAFRIFQEAVNNTLKHAKANNIYISLKNKEGFSLEICDDGKGFNLKQGLGKTAGLGLRNIYKRADLAALHCIISTEPGKGCIYTLTKIKEKEEKE